MGRPDPSFFDSAQVNVQILDDQLSQIHSALDWINESDKMKKLDIPTWEKYLRNFFGEVFDGDNPDDVAKKLIKKNLTDKQDPYLDKRYEAVIYQDTIYDKENGYTQVQTVKYRLKQQASQTEVTTPDEKAPPSSSPATTPQIPSSSHHRKRSV